MNDLNSSKNLEKNLTFAPPTEKLDFVDQNFALIAQSEHARFGNSKDTRILFLRQKLAEKLIF